MTKDNASNLVTTNLPEEKGGNAQNETKMPEPIKLDSKTYSVKFL